MARPPLRVIVALETSIVSVPQTTYPGEVLCRRCRHFMIAGDADGRTWECWICSRQIRVELQPPPSSAP